MDPKISDLLVDCLHEDASRLGPERLRALTPVEWQALLTLASEKQVIELFYERLKARGLESETPAAIRQTLQQASLRNATHNLGFYAELKRITAILHANQIPVIVLKGSHLAEIVYGNLALREMRDMDLLVPVEKLGQAAAILEAQGYQPKRPYAIETGFTNSQHLPRFVKRPVASIELHWNITRAGRHYTIDPAELWERAEPVRLAGANLLGLCAEDLLLHLALHVSYQHQFEMGLRPACDIAQVIRHYGAALDWSLIVERTRRWRWERGVYLALRLAQELVGAVVPAAVLADLRPVGLDEAIVAAARMQVFSDWSVGRTIPRNLANQWESARLTDKIGELWRAVFMPKPIISALYGISAHSPRIYLYYPVRCKDLLVKYWRTAFQLYRDDPSLTPLARRKAMLARWLAEA